VSACVKCGESLGSVGVGGWAQPWRYGWELCARCSYGFLREGDETVLGIIEDVSVTAYLIAGRWVPFCRVHGTREMVQPFPGLLDWGLA